MTDGSWRRRFLSRSLGLLMGAAGVSARPGQGASAGAQRSPRPESEGEADWEAARRQLLIPEVPAYLNTGSLGPMPRSVLAARQRVALALARDPLDPDQFDPREALRRTLAAFVGTSPDEIALLRSTTEGMNTFAHGIDWRPGDEVIMCTHEHPGGYGAYKALEARRGIRIRWVQLSTPPEDIEQILDLYRAAIGPRARLIMASHITFVTGLLMPVRHLAELAHRKGLLISLDGAHPLGMLPLSLNALGCDHYAASGHKWLLAGPGTGLCYVRRELQDDIWPLMGYAENSSQDPRRRGARKYELYGQKNLPTLLAMGAALAWQADLDPQRIEARVRMLGDCLRRGLVDIPGVKLWTPLSPELSAGLTSFSVDGLAMHDVARAIRGLAGAYVLPMPVGGLDAVRVSTHFYNSLQEVERLLDAVRRIAAHPLDYV